MQRCRFLGCGLHRAAWKVLALHDTCMSTNQITPTRDEVVAVYTAAFRG